MPRWRGRSGVHVARPGPGPRASDPASEVRSLDAETMAEMDAFADGTLTAYLRSERTIWDYRWSDRFDSSFDTWATTSDWVRLADGLVGGDWPDPAAVLVLLDVGDPRGDRSGRSAPAN